jgi:hypothetical protein
MNEGGKRDNNGDEEGEGNGEGGKSDGAARGMAAATRVAGDEREGDDGGDGPWFVCVFVCVERPQKIRKRAIS